ncbi:hypothetical protein KIN20_019980 [Parelaphostrongylus tenuis]|uniref:Uncharacterized protein n=1 Tax=Parelaphostrongylus tenuis TaxID=148309 RepID=A0AAD5QSW5_PARTN|nr:hypothetical protein KIN20_019980 [Parelaphostrongylus tenuis]
MAAHVCVELDQINELPELIDYLIQRNYRFTATKDHLSLCAGCNVKMRSSYVPDPASHQIHIDSLISHLLS